MTVLPVTTTCVASLPGHLSLNNVLVSPRLIKNLISVRQFTSDNNCSVEFDHAGCSVKDLTTQRVIVRCNSSGRLYPLIPPTAQALAASSTSSLWHRRLGHRGHEVLAKVASVVPFCTTAPSSICHACQLGRHTHLPFQSSNSRATSNLQIIFF